MSDSADGERSTGAPGRDAERQTTRTDDGRALASTSRLDFDRRSLLQGLTAMGGVGLLGLGTSGSAAAQIDTSSRLSDAESNRNHGSGTLIGRYEEADVAHASNDDESVIHNVENGPITLPYVYQKALPGSTYRGGQIPETAYESYLVDPVEQEDWDSIQTEAQRKLVCPNASREWASEGIDPWLGTMPPAPDHDSDRTKAELVDLYWMAENRDFHLQDLNFNSHREHDFQNVFPESNLFNTDDPGRGVLEWPGTPGTAGPPVSQFLLHDVRRGTIPDTPEIVYFDEQNYGTTKSDWRDVVGGETPGIEPGPQGQPEDPENSGKDTRFVHTGRDLAALVREDASYELYLRAALVLGGNGAPLDEDLAYTDDDHVFPYVESGAVAVADILARVARNALLAAWHHKWAVHRRIRPETYAERVDRYAGSSDDDLRLDGFHGNDGSQIFGQIRGSETNAEESLLTTAYPEGSPAHPAYPSGHSTLGGACVTVLKAMFADVPLENFGLDVLQSTSTGDRTDYFGDDTGDVTVHRELNKLLQNIGLGRCWAGVHYRTDHVYGALLGEQVAVATLIDQYFSNSNTSNVTYPRLSGSTVKFTPLVRGDVIEGDSRYDERDSNLQIPPDVWALDDLREQAQNVPI